MCVKPASSPSAWITFGPDRLRGVELGAGDLPRHVHDPLDPGRSPSPRAGSGSSASEWKRTLPSTVMVSKLYSWPRRNSSARTSRCSATAGSRGARRAARATWLIRQVALQPIARGRLQHDREPDVLDEAPRRPPALDAACGGRPAARAGAARPSCAPCRGTGPRSRTGARDAERARATSRAGTCSGSRMPEHAVDAPCRCASALPASVSWSASSPSGMSATSANTAARRTSGGSWTMPSRRTSSRLASRRAKRIVVSSGNGATNTTLRMAGSAMAPGYPAATVRAQQRARERLPRPGPRVTGAPMNVVFLAPNYPPEMQRVHARPRRGRGQRLRRRRHARAGLAPRSRKRHLADYLQVPRIIDESST